MKDNFTSINVILDRSGSMCSLASDTIGGFNQFLKDQKELPGEAILTLCTFSTLHSIVHNGVKLSDVPDLNEKTYQPAGGTALLDAMGTMIEVVGNNLSKMPEDERPSKVIFLIITDGQENSSTKFNYDQIKQMVLHQQEKYNWNFVFMGANLDAITEGKALGISIHNTLNYSATSTGTEDLYRSVSKNMTRYRSVDNSSANGFFDENEESKK